MPRARYTAEGGTYRIDGQSFEPGDEYEVSRTVADHLQDVDDFEVILEKDDAAPREEDGPPDDELGYEERTALAEGLANESWQAAVSAVEDGEADAYLDELEQVDDRNSVQEAIDERRDELEG